MQLIRTNGYIHLFFVPVFRYDIQYFLICPNCGKTYEISLEDGRRLERYVPHVLGFPSHPMSAADVEAKAAELMAPALGQARASAVIAAVRNLETLPDAGALVRLIAR